MSRAGSGGVAPTVRELIGEIALRLEQGGVADARREAALLMALATGMNRAQLRARDGEGVPAGVAERARALGERRAARVPHALLRGSQEFMGLEFFVTPDTLIPRHDTETLVKRAEAALMAKGGGALLEVGTGSGCVAISLLARHPLWRASATDLSAAALALARRNAERHRVAARLALHEADLWPPGDGRFPLIACNPPYIPSAQIAELPPEVRDHEPRAALDGGPDGLAVIRRLLAGAGERLEPAGLLLLEHGARQREAVAALARERGWAVLGAVDDLAGLPRVLLLARAGG